MRTISEIFRSWAILDEDGRHVGGTDKQSNHAYGDTYERLFPDRRGVGLIMEVGVADGSSLLAWMEVFPNAHVVGLDIHPAARLRERDYRMEMHVADATERTSCEVAANGRQFDFICEDASHRLTDNLRTLFYLWPYIKPGGIYVIEEFADIGSLRRNVLSMWPFAEIIDTTGPFGGTEPLVVLRKPT